MSVSNPRALNLPAQTGPYAVKVKGSNGCRWSDYSTLRLEISVGASYHEGEKFAATARWAAARYDRVVILVNDTLQRHNIIFNKGLSANAAHADAFAEGSEWLLRNAASIAQIPGAEIYRWDAWRRSRDYFHALRATRALSRSSRRYADLLHHSVFEIWDRRCGTGPFEPSRKEEFFQISKDYLIEETAVFALVYRDIPGLSAYPGSFGDLWQMFLDNPPHGILSGLANAHCLRIDFSRREKTVNQGFE